MQPDHQCAAGLQSRDQPLHDFLLLGEQKIGEHCVATEDEIERPVWNALADVLLQEIHGAQRGADAILCAAAIECCAHQVFRQFLGAARQVATYARAAEHGRIDVSCDYA